ncbi:MAG: 23S rRNA (adenine(2030)-N(6))-methyltransferase RlmJ [Hyphomicrobiaceae bacterium]
MNYRHAYHAGNFADVLKHAVLALVIEHLKRKPAPFRVIDTHAGRGLYRLDDEAALKTGEWRTGIGRLLGPDARPMPDQIAQLLSPYLAQVRLVNPNGGLTLYPGSPLLALGLMRGQDYLVANELHGDDGRALKAALAHDLRAKVLNLDAWVALKSLLPPKERRGVVLVDPPFEATGELERLAEGLTEAVQRFATGCYLLWFPVKEASTLTRLVAALPRADADKLLLVELRVQALETSLKLAGSGLAILNPPHPLKGQLDALLPFLVDRLAQGSGAGARVVAANNLVGAGRGEPVAARASRSKRRDT